MKYNFKSIDTKYNKNKKIKKYILTKTTTKFNIHFQIYEYKKHQNYEIYTIKLI